MPRNDSVCVKTILILAALPNGLRLDKEIRSIEECIRRAVRRDSYKIISKTAVRPQDIRRAIAEEKPQIVHFCGHGLEDGSLLLDDDGGQERPVSPQGLAALFELHKDYVDCVLLNACHSVKSAIAISEYINYAIGMNQEIQDNSAIQFSQGFYDGLGYETSENQDRFRRAFEEGLVALKMRNPSSAEIPVMKTKINASQTVIFGNAQRRAGIPFQAPPLPSYYVDRPEYSSELKKRLLTKSNDMRTLVVTAIHGLGSIGKSTITTALAHDIDVQAHFSDGILWATLGQKPDTLSLLSGWIQALNDHNFKPTSVNAASSHLRTLLYDKAVLVVVDDAWNPLDAQAFNVCGACCQVLVTTRDKAIAKVLEANTYTLDVMKPEQAMVLLSRKLGRDFDSTELQSASDFATAVGYLPLALELGAATVASGTSWKDLVQDIKLEIARLKTLDDPGARDIDDNDEASLKRLSLRASLNLSIQRLDPESKQNFAWLGVLPEDATITPKLITTLWEQENERDAIDTLKYMLDKALLLPGVSLEDGTETYRLHDLFHDLACNLLTAPLKPKRRGDLPGLGITLENAHATLLEKYRQKIQNNLWHTLPDDGYIHQRLVWHLEKAKRIEEIHLLLQEETESGGNGWYEACDRLGQNANFVTDVARAWQLAEEDCTETTLPQVIGLQGRYALMIASLNSLAANLPVELLIALIKKNVWTPSQGLAYVLQSSNPKQKANLLTELVNHLPPTLKELGLLKALAAAREIQDESSRAKALIRLAEKLPELLPEVLAAAREIQSERERADVLNSLAEKLPPKLLPEVLPAAREIQDESIRVYALIRLADKLPELLPEALAAAREIQSESSRVYALIRLADKLPELLPEALAAAREIQDESDRTDVLISLADKLPELLPEALAAAREIQSEFDRVYALIRLADKLPKLLSEALAAVKQIQDESYRAQALSSLADKLPSELLPEALAAAREIQDESDRAKALSSLADKLPPELLPEALAAAKLIQDESYRAKALSSLADKLPPELLPEALAAAKLIQDESYRAQPLSALADKLPELLLEALAAAKLIQDESYRAQALSALADKLPPELLLEALAAAKLIQDEFERAKALIHLADKLPELLPEALAALAAAREIQHYSYRAKALIRLADKLPELLPEALAAARDIQSERERADVLIRLADKLPELLPEVLAAAREIQSEFYRAYALSSLVEKLPELLSEALAAARKIQSEFYRVYVLSSLADKLLPELLPEVLAAAREIQSEFYRVYVLSSLAKKLPELLPETLAAAREIQSEFYRVYVLSSLAEKLPELLPETLAAVRDIQFEFYRADVLSSLAEKLPPELFPEILAAASEIRFKFYRADVLSSLAKKLPPELLPEILAAASEIQDEMGRAKALSLLADQLPPELLPEALAAARKIHSESDRADALSSLAPILPPELLPEALTAAREIHSESSRGKALSSLAPILPPELLPEALAAARKIHSESDRAKALNSLADKLPELLPEALAAAREIQSKFDRAKALSSLAKKLSQIQKTPLFSLWRKTLHILSVHTRPDLLTDIKALTHVIFTLGDKQAVKDIANAIQDVSRWWG